MTDDDIPSGRPGYRADRPPLRRDRGSRMVAGVCGGLGRHLDVDPVIFRVLFTVTTFFGGMGLLIYAAAWLLVPADGEEQAEAQKLLSGGSTLVAIAMVVVMVIGFAAMTRTLADGFGAAVPLLAVAAVIVVVLAWRDQRGPGAPPPRRDRPAGVPDPSAPQPWWQRPVSAYPPAAEGGGMTAGGDLPRSPEEPAVPSAGGGAAGTEGWAPPSAPAGPDAPARRRIGGLLVASLLVVLGVLGVLAAAGAIHIGWAAGLALTVLALGVGMTVGGLYGRVRWLIPFGLVLAVPLILVQAIGVPLDGQTGTVTWSPVTGTAAAGSPYELGFGSGDLDLSALDPTGGTVSVDAQVGAGRLVVTTPADVALRVTLHLGAGRFRAPGGSPTGGLDLTKSFDVPAVGTSRGTLVLDLRVGAGYLEVDHG